MQSEFQTRRLGGDTALLSTDYLAPSPTDMFPKPYFRECLGNATKCWEPSYLVLQYTLHIYSYMFSAVTYAALHLRCTQTRRSMTRIVHTTVKPRCDHGGLTTDEVVVPLAAEITLGDGVDRFVGKLKGQSRVSVPPYEAPLSRRGYAPKTHLLTGVENELLCLYRTQAVNCSGECCMNKLAT